MRQPSPAANGLPFNGDYGWRRMRNESQWAAMHRGRFQYYARLSKQLKTQNYEHWAVYRLV
tara:strand:- start:911 stop:1093 length:183 start_codon:yes stop_codon:yes gene_type:complete